MRSVPLLVALLVCAVTYALIIERDRIMALAGKPENGESAEEVVEVSSNPALRPAVSVLVERSVAEQVRNHVVLRGRTEAFRHVDVRSETSGRVISQPLRKGAMVEEGQLLCEIDPGGREAAVVEARARLLDAQTRNEASSRLAEKGFASESTAIAGNAALETARAALVRAEREIDRLRILAPFPGLLETDAAEIGSLLQPGSLCATIISLDPIKLVGFATELQVGGLEAGTLAGARLASGQAVEGVLTFVSRSADPKTRTFRVEVTAPNPDLSIRDGSTAEIFVASSDQRAHLLPLSALTLDDDGRLGVRSVINGQVRFFPVTVFQDTREGAWLGGLPDEIDVIVVGQEFVAEGQDVAVSYRGDPQ